MKIRVNKLALIILIGISLLVIIFVVADIVTILRTKSIIEKKPEVSPEVTLPSKKTKRKLTKKARFPEEKKEIRREVISEEERTWLGKEEKIIPTD